MRRKILCLIILSLIAAPASARRFRKGPVELMVDPARAPETAGEYLLLPKDSKLTDADAVALYEQAIAAMKGGRKQDKQVRDWLDLPPEQLPQEQVEEMIQKNSESLRLVARAARCKRCNWPKWTPGTNPPDQSAYRSMAFLLELRARFEIVHGQYDRALPAMQTGFAMSRHIGEGPTSIQAMVGTAVGAVMCKEVEVLIKSKDSPNLYRAMANLPKPFADVNNAIDSEIANLENYNFLVRRQMEKVLKPAHDRMLLIAKRMQNNLNVLQCVEAVRHYAATHEGQLPAKLVDITELELPTDAFTGKPLEYRRTDQGAVVQSSMPEGGDPVDITRYEIIVRK